MNTIRTKVFITAIIAAQVAHDAHPMLSEQTGQVRQQ